MKKIMILPALMISLILFATSCSKDDSSVTEKEMAKTATLSFGAALDDVLKSQLQKQQLQDLPECSDAEPASVEFILSLDGVNVVGDVGDLASVAINPEPNDSDNDGVEEYFTNDSAELELAPGNYVLEWFQVLDGQGNVIWAAPIDTGEPGNFSGLVDAPLPLDINLGAGVKKYVPVGVLCWDDRLVNQYGYLFFELEDTVAIEFCIFGNICDETGRHAPANFRFDVWTYSGDTENPKGVALFNESDPYINVVGVDENGDEYAEPLCLFLPDSPVEDIYYGELYLLENGTSTLIRQGNFTDADVASLFDEVDSVDYYHFREGGCTMEDSPNLFEEGDNGGGGDGNFEQNYFTIQNGVFNGESIPSSNSEILEILEIRGNSNILAGGSNLIEVIASGNTTELIVGVQGQEGYFTIPMDEIGGNATSSIDLLLLLSQQAADSFTIVFTPSDGQGNYGQSETLLVTTQVGGTGLLQISLSWNQPNDVDLHLIQPDGQRIYFGTTTSTNGGELDVDSNAACSIDNINNENIYYADLAEVTVQNGEYEVLVDLWSNCDIPDNTNYNVVAYYDGELIVPTTGVNPFEGVLTPEDESGNTNWTSVMTFDIQNGATTRSREGQPSETYKTSVSKKIYKFGYDKDNKVFENFNPKID